MKSYNLKMNLQLFADPSASLQNTTGTMTNEMKTFYEKRLIVADRRHNMCRKYACGEQRNCDIIMSYSLRLIVRRLY